MKWMKKIFAITSIPFHIAEPMAEIIRVASFIFLVVLMVALTLTVMGLAIAITHMLSLSAGL